MVLIHNGSTDGDKVLIPWKLEDRYAKTFRYNSAATLVAPTHSAEGMRDKKGCYT